MNSKGKDFLEHYGILGMRWGRRKGKTATSTVPAQPKISSEDHAKITKIKGKKLHELSNAEIKAFSERMQLEKQYKDLTKATMSPGAKFVNELLATAAKEAATTFVKKYAAKGADDLLKMVT